MAMPISQKLANLERCLKLKLVSCPALFCALAGAALAVEPNPASHRRAVDYVPDVSPWRRRP